jgi:predicted DNA-binding transcriptional regulator AlpA
MKIDVPTEARILVDASGAAALCNVSRSTWLAWDRAGICPRSIRINGRVLWCRQDIERWAALGCPDRQELMRRTEAGTVS